MSVVVFYSYIYVVYKSIKLIKNKPHLPHGYIIFGLMTYLIPASGNPILFSIPAVFAHTASLFLISETKKGQS
jgi:hypothetical protein